jgi:hypothetical protein
MAQIIAIRFSAAVEMTMDSSTFVRIISAYSPLEISQMNVKMTWVVWRIPFARGICVLPYRIGRAVHSFAIPIRDAVLRVTPFASEATHV